MRRNLFILFGVVLILGIGGGLFMYYKPHPNLTHETPDFQLTSAALFEAFEQNEAEANTQYLNRLVEVEGEVVEMNAQKEGGYTLVLSSGNEMFGVNCAFLPEDSEGLGSVSVGEKIRVKGLCTGMLMDVNLSRCVLLSE